MCPKRNPYTASRPSDATRDRILYHYVHAGDRATILPIGLLSLSTLHIIIIIYMRRCAYIPPPRLVTADTTTLPPRKSDIRFHSRPDRSPGACGNNNMGNMGYNILLDIPIGTIKQTRDAWRRYECARVYGLYIILL